MVTILNILIFCFCAYIFVLITFATLTLLNKGVESFISAIRKFFGDPIGVSKSIIKDTLWYFALIAVGVIYIFIFYIGSVLIFGLMIMGILVFVLGLEPDGPYQPALWSMGLSIPFAGFVVFNAHRVLRLVLPKFVMDWWKALER